METKANHVLIGAFTLAVSLAMVVFALWAAKFTSDSSWREYDVVFKEAVSGLSTGSSVQYNGIGVGTVRNLSLAPDDPRQVIARVRLRTGTPVRQDTRATLAFVGLTGVAFIQLSGGRPDSPPLVSTDGQVPVIIARTSALQTLLSSSEDVATTASEVLLRLKSILSEQNAEHVSATLTSVEQLARTLNAQRGEIAAMLSAARVAAEGFQNTMRSAENTMARLDHSAQVIDQTLIADLPQISADLKRTLAQLARVSSEAETVLGPNGSASDALGARGLGQAGPTLSELRGLLRELSQLSRQIEQNPAAFLLGGDDRKEYDPK